MGSRGGVDPGHGYGDEWVAEEAGVGGDGDVGGAPVGCGVAVRCGVAVGGTEFDGVVGNAGFGVAAGDRAGGAGESECCRVAGVTPTAAVDGGLSA